MKKTIEKRIANLQKCINNAERYLEQGINVEGSAFLHLDDWKGHSGHPKWVKNKMIPTLKKAIHKQEKLIDRLERKEKDKNVTNERHSKTVHNSGIPSYNEGIRTE